MATEVSINTEPIQAFFTSIDSQKNLLSTITDLHKNLTQHFTKIQQTLTLKSQTLDTQIREFDQNTQNSLQNLHNRECAIPEREASLASRVEERKAKAVEEIEGCEGSLGEKSLPELLRFYFKRMDSERLVRMILVKRKESATMRAEIAAAAEEAVDPMRLVLDAVEEFVTMKAEGKAGLADRRWVCGVLVHSVVPVSQEGGGVGRSLKERALSVLEKWKGILGGGEGSDGVGASEATMFLQMVIGFGLKEKFKEEFLRKLVVEFASRRDMPRLAVALGFADKTGDIIDELVKSGREIEAVYFAYEFKLTERFSPVTLLKSCLKICRKNANDISKTGNFKSTAVEKANNMELETTKAIIKCVQDHNLESQFSLESLKKRVTQLEKAKAEKKKSADSTIKHSNKRALGGRGRSGGPPSSRPPKASRYSNPSPFRQRTPLQPHHGQAARFSGPYSYPNQNAYEVPGTASYGQGYTQNPVGLIQQYPYAPQDVGGGAAQGGGVSYGGQESYDSRQSGSGSHVYSAAPVTYPASYPPHSGAPAAYSAPHPPHSGSPAAYSATYLPPQ